MRCIAGEKDVAHLQMAIDPMRNLKIRFPYRWTGRLNVFKFAKRIFLGTYYSPDWILLWRLVYVVNDADEENKPITIEENTWPISSSNGPESGRSARCHGFSKLLPE